MSNSFYGLTYADIIAYANEEKVYCVLCVDELDIPKTVPLFGFTRTRSKKYCDGCEAEISFIKAKWICKDCGTSNYYDIDICEGCSNRK